MTKYYESFDARYLEMVSGDTPNYFMFRTRNEHEDSHVWIQLPRERVEALHKEMGAWLKQPPLTDEEKEIVRCIRAICVNEFYDVGSDKGMTRTEYFNYPFFYDEEAADGMTPDAFLLKLFREERPHHNSDFWTVLVLCHG